MMKQGIFWVNFSLILLSCNKMITTKSGEGNENFLIGNWKNKNECIKIERGLIISFNKLSKDDTSYYILTKDTISVFDNDTNLIFPSNNSEYILLEFENPVGKDTNSNIKDISYLNFDKKRLILWYYNKPISQIVNYRKKRFCRKK
jgi:hypothetical protein